MPTRIMLVDDHPLVREGLKSLLAADKELEIVAETGSGKEAVDLAARLTPDLVILDVTLPDLNGVETMRQIRRAAPETEAIALSMHGAAQVVEDMLRAGASGYILKSASVQELRRAIQIVMSGGTYLCIEVRATAPTELLRCAADDRRTMVARELTPREREVLTLVAEGKSSKEIAERLFVTTKTIVWHRQSIMDKLDLRSVAELTKYAVRMGHTPP